MNTMARIQDLLTAASHLAEGNRRCDMLQYLIAMAISETEAIARQERRVPPSHTDLPPPSQGGG